MLKFILNNERGQDEYNFNDFTYKFVDFCA